MKKVALTLVVLVLLTPAAAVAFIYSGLYNVAATAEHIGIVSWGLDTLSDRSVSVHARGISAPNLDDMSPDEGLEHFRAMCVTCHGAPGIERSETGQGLYPQPPDLTISAQELSSEELYWVTKHGMKMTGMPAYGPTHSDAQIWSLVSFLKTLPELSADSYREKVRLTGLESEAHEHSEDHHGEEPEHEIDDDDEHDEHEGDPHEH